MTARKYPLKPRGHAQKRPSKDLLLKLLRAHGPQMVTELAAASRMGTKLVRQHLEELCTYGEVFRDPNAFPAVYSHEQVFARKAPVKMAKPAIFSEDKPICIWSKSWKLEAIPGPRSVFEMGAV